MNILKHFFKLSLSLVSRKEGMATSGIYLPSEVKAFDGTSSARRLLSWMEIQ